MIIQMVRMKGEIAYIYEDICCDAIENIQSAVYVFGETVVISKYLQLPEGNKKYFMARAYRVKDERKSYNTDKVNATT